jgi:hypothetical protein
MKDIKSKLKIQFMKRVIYYTAMMTAMLLLAVSTSCISSQSAFPVKGSGDLKDKTYSVSDFKGVEVSGGFDVNLEQGNEEKVILSAQENLFEYINVRVEGGILKIYTDRNVIASRGLKAKIYLKSIESLNVSGGGDVVTENILDLPNIDINLSGGGDLKSTLKTNQMRCDISGGGDAEFSGEIKKFEAGMSGGGDLNSDIASNDISCSLSGGGNVTFKNKEKANEVNIDISGGGDVSFETEADHVRCSLSGGGDATLAGSAGTLEVSVSGGGDINANNFVTQRTSFKANGGSDVHVNATAQITGNISGGGDVYYAGNPPSVDIDAKGGSEVHKE